VLSRYFCHHEEFLMTKEKEKEKAFKKKDAHKRKI
jgi:hypothetical protein